MKNRDDIRDQFSPLLDGELSPGERARVEAALSEDAELLRELDSLKRVDDLYRALPAVSAPPDFEDAIRERIRPSRAAVAACAPAMARPERRRIVWPGLAAAAVVAVCLGGVVVTMNRSAGRLQMAGDFAKVAEPSNQTPAAPAYRDAPASPLPLGTVPPLKNEAERPADEHFFQAPATAETLQLKRSIGAPEVRTGDTASAALGKQQEKALADKDETARTQEVAGMDQFQATAPTAKEGVATQAEPRADSLGIEAVDRQNKGPGPAQSTPEMLNFGAEAKLDAPAETPAPAAAPMPVPPPAPATPVPPIAQAKEEAARHKTPAKDESAVIGSSVQSHTIGPRAFTLRDGVWYESGYNDEKAAPLKRDSRAMRDLVAQHADLKELTTLKEAVVFKVEDKWYKLSAISK